MSKENFSGQKLGILGGGQLGLMFIQAAMNYGLELFILDPDSNAPCSTYCKNFSTGSFLDEETVYNFGKQLNIVTIEIENVNVNALKRLEKEGVRVYPQPHVIELIQNKGLQKQFFLDHSIPTAPFVYINSKNQLTEFISMFPAVMKSRKAGYDGRGVYNVNTEAEISGGFEVPSILEKRIKFIKELSVLVARNETGEIKTFDVVEMEFNRAANLVEYLIAPARISEKIETEARALAISIIEQLQMVGLLAVELFLTAEGVLIVNELAPRPHNSGHHTIEANYVSQYEQHLRAILDLHLGSTRARSNAVMLNILGEPGFDGPTRYQGIELLAEMEGVYIHLYGKKITRPNRKMGHITIINADLEAAYVTARYIKENFRVTT